MKTEELIKEGALGGPGLDGYAYNADIYCVDCGKNIMKEVAADVAPDISNISDTTTDKFPQPIFFGEHETAQNCGECGEYLYGSE